jgi:hypothetical protein
VTASEPTGAAGDEASNEEVHVDQPTSTSPTGPDQHDPRPSDTSSDEGEHHAVPSLLEVAIFAPIDAAFSVLRDPGGAATRGRARVEQALRQARAIGELSVKFGARELRRRTEGTGQPDPAAKRPTAPASHPDAGPAPDDVIADYDALSASQIVPMLSSLKPEERARVADYEARSRGRQTILRRVEQLDGDGA